MIFNSQVIITHTLDRRTQLYIEQNPSSSTQQTHHKIDFHKTDWISMRTWDVTLQDRVRNKTERLEFDRSTIHHWDTISEWM